MKARRIIFLLTVIFLLMFMFVPDASMPSAYAEDDPPLPDPLPPSSRYAVIFPFVTNFSYEQGGQQHTFDTWFSIAGDSTSLEGEETPYVDLYFYDSSGSLIGTMTDDKEATSENSQWMWALSNCGLQQEVFPGFVIALTNIPSVEAACFIADPQTGATCDAPAIVDYSIAAIEEDGQIIRYETHVPPEDWYDLEPADDEIEPYLHHTTLIFPFVSYVPGQNGFETGIAITNTFDATGVEDRSVTFYLYGPDGSKVGECTLPLSGEGAVSPMCGFVLSDILTTMGAGDFTGAGYIIAHVNIPFAQGYSVVNYSGAYFHSAAGAKVDNNIYAFTDGVPQRLIEPESDHTSIVVPFVTNATNYWTGVSVANTVPVGEAVDADFYLYDMSGNFVTDWTSTMGSGDELNEMLLVFVSGTTITVNGAEKYSPLAPGFQGWLLIIVHAPGAEGMLMMSDTNFNSLSMTRAAVDNDIIGVSEEEDHEGEIIRANPPAADAGDSWSIPFVNTTEGWASVAVTVNTRSRSEWQATFKYQGWTEAGAGLQSWTDTASGSEELFPARMQNVSQIPRDGYSTLVGRLRVETNTSCAHGLAAYISGDWIFKSEAEAHFCQNNTPEVEVNITVTNPELAENNEEDPGLVLLKDEERTFTLSAEKKARTAAPFFWLETPEDDFVKIYMKKPGEGSQWEEIVGNILDIDKTYQYKIVATGPGVGDLVLHYGDSNRIDKKSDKVKMRVLNAQGKTILPVLAAGEKSSFLPIEQMKKGSSRTLETYDAQTRAKASVTWTVTQTGTEVKINGGTTPVDGDSVNVTAGNIASENGVTIAGGGVNVQFKVVQTGDFALAGHGATARGIVGGDDNTEDGRATRTGFTWNWANTGLVTLTRFTNWCAGNPPKYMERLYTFTHGWTKGFIMDFDEAFYVVQYGIGDAKCFADMQTAMNANPPTIRFLKGCQIRLQSCHLGIVDDSGKIFGKELSTIVKGTVYAAKGWSNSVDKNGKETGWFFSDRAPWAKFVKGREIANPWLTEKDLKEPNAFETQHMNFHNAQ